jgi:hypothetical protein
MVMYCRAGSCKGKAASRIVKLCSGLVVAMRIRVVSCKGKESQSDEGIAKSRYCNELQSDELY